MTYIVEHNEIEKEFVSLDMAMDYAKTLDMFVVIKGSDGLEIAGKFGVFFLLALVLFNYSLKQVLLLSMITA